MNIIIATTTTKAKDIIIGESTQNQVQSITPTSFSTIKIVVRIPTILVPLKELFEFAIVISLRSI